MTIHLYKSAFCPRCAYAGNVLKQLQNEQPDLNIITHDLFTGMKAFKEAKITMIPSIVIEDAKTSWILPKAEEVRSFVLERLK